MSLEPVAFFHCQQARKYDSPRQPGYVKNTGEVRFLPGQNYEQALTGIEGFAKIWLVFGFHLNSHWKPMVRPQNIDHKVGVFATRSPYRPNGLGMSCVTLESRRDLCLTVSSHDLIDQTPIYDVKPYHVSADAHSASEALRSSCWYQLEDHFQVRWREPAQLKRDWLEQRGIFLESFVQSQLSSQPFDEQRKRVSQVSKKKWCLAYQTWRLYFSIGRDRELWVEEVTSGYSDLEIEESSSDPYQDKKQHIDFRQQFLPTAKAVDEASERTMP